MGTEDVKVENILFEKLGCEGNLREKTVVFGEVFVFIASVLQYSFH